MQRRVYRGFGAFFFFPPPGLLGGGGAPMWVKRRRQTSGGQRQRIAMPELMLKGRTDPDSGRAPQPWTQKSKRRSRTASTP